MITITSSIDIYRSAEIVFDFISAPVNNFEWQYGTLASHSTSPGVTGAGATFQTVGHLMGRRMNSTFEVTEYQRNQRYSYRSLSGPLQLVAVFSLHPGIGRTRVTVTTQAAPANLISGSEREIEQYVQRQMRADLVMLKQVLETRSARKHTPVPTERPAEGS